MKTNLLIHDTYHGGQPSLLYIHPVYDVVVGTTLYEWTEAAAYSPGAPLI